MALWRQRTSHSRQYGRLHPTNHKHLDASFHFSYDSLSLLIHQSCANNTELQAVCFPFIPEMATEKTEYTPVQGGPSPPLLPGQPAFPVAFDGNTPDTHIIGGLPFPAPTAFGPGAAGVYGMDMSPRGGPGYFTNPLPPPYSPPNMGFNANTNG